MNAITDHDNAATPVRAQDLERHLAALREQLGRVLLGKSDQIDLVIACLLARGHLLLDDLPGTGKTTLAKSLAACLGGRLARIQCTPDLLPTDVTGFNLFNQKTREFEFHPGPVFADVLLADELNRTTPRTQSALLEAMAERQVTIDAVPHTLSDTFFVIATQNSIDSHGAYPLPEAQLDRFSIKLEIGYPDRGAQLEILESAAGGAHDNLDLAPVLPLDELTRLQQHTSLVTVHPRVREYLVDLVEATRNDPLIQLGVSPRGMLHWQRIAQAWAVVNQARLCHSQRHRTRRASRSVSEIANHRRRRRRRDFKNHGNCSRPGVQVMRVVVVLICGFTLLVGCVSQDTAKTSHFEHDHEVAAHWPDGLADAAAQIRGRLERTDHDHSRAHQHGHPHDEGHHDDHHHDHHHDPGDEIADIVSWVPEIAADTNLSEQDWIPLDDAAESLSANLRAADNELTAVQSQANRSHCAS